MSLLTSSFFSLYLHVEQLDLMNGVDSQKLLVYSNAKAGSYETHYFTFDFREFDLLIIDESTLFHQRIYFI